MKKGKCWDCKCDFSFIRNQSPREHVIAAPFLHVEETLGKFKESWCLTLDVYHVALPPTVALAVWCPSAQLSPHALLVSDDAQSQALVSWEKES